jgi:hypothetical protein
MIMVTIVLALRRKNIFTSSNASNRSTSKKVYSILLVISSIRSGSSSSIIDGSCNCGVTRNVSVSDVSNIIS